MENEVRDVTYLSIGLILVAILLSFISYGLTVKSELAGVRNRELRSHENVEQYREYNAYDQKTLFGDEVIELIRAKYDSGISIFVDYRANVSTGDVIDSDDTCIYCGTEGNHRIYNLDNYIDHANAPSDYNYFILAQNAISAERNDLRNWYPSTSKYRAYLVYNSEDPMVYYERLMDNYELTKDSMPDTEKGKLEALDNGVPVKPTGAEVTGIVLISYHTLELPDRT